jgi:hypothetical protein
MIARGWHAVIAVLVTIALVVQVIVAIRVSGAGPATQIGTLRGTSVVGRLIRVFSFFTIQSNLLSGVVSAQLAVRPGRDGRAWRAVRLAALFGITVTGIVYSTVLAAVHTPNGAAETFVNDIVHYVVPVMMVLGWLLFGPRPRITGSIIGWALVWPVLWFAYTLARGEASGWYPYPFVDAATQGYARVMLNAVAVTAVFAAVCVLFFWLDRRLPAQPASARTTRDGLGRPS